MNVNRQTEELHGSPIRVFLLDASPTMRAVFPEYLKEEKDIVLCGSAASPQRALNELERLKPDILLIGLEAPYEEWLYFLETFRRMPCGRMAHVIVTSTDLRERICREFTRYGVDCFMARPVHLPLLMDHIRHVSSRTENLRPDINALVTEVVLSFEIGMKLLGCTYIADALLILLMQGKPYPRMEEIYRILTERYDTTESCVESAMRKAIKRIFQQNSAMLQEMLHLSHIEGTNHLANADFLFMLAAGVQIKYRL